MADAFITSPRRKQVLLSCHPAEIVSMAIQMLDVMTDAELDKLIEFTNQEKQRRKGTKDA